MNLSFDNSSIFTHQYRANIYSVLLDEGRTEDDAAREVGGRAPRGVHDAAPRHGARVRQRVLLS